MAEKKTQLSSPEARLARREHSTRDPFFMFERFAEGIDRVFDDMGFGHGWLSKRGKRQSPWAGLSSDVELWSPAIDVFHRGTELVVRADLPGMNKEDISVDVTEDGISIQGERKREQSEEHEGVYRSERSYGSFFRMVPLPEGAMTDQAKAEFKDGVLEITMPAPPEQVRRGRRIEVSDGRRPASPNT